MRNMLYRSLGILSIIISLQVPSAFADINTENNLFESSISYAGQTFSVPGTLGLLRQTADCDPAKTAGAKTAQDAICHTLDAQRFEDPDAPGVQLTLYNTALLSGSSQESVMQFARGLETLKKTLDGRSAFASYGTFQASASDIVAPDILHHFARPSSTMTVADVRVLKANNTNVGLVYLAADARGQFPGADLYMDYVFLLPKTQILGVYSMPVTSAKNQGTENFAAFVSARLKTTTGKLAQMQAFDAVLETYASQYTTNKPAYTSLLGAVSEMIASAKTTPFVDVFPSTQFAEAILAMRARGIIGGYADSTFKPMQSVNRAEFMKILIESKKPGDLTTYAKKCFPDVDGAAWFAKYVCYGKEKGIIDGYSDGTFRPETTVNLAEALKITFKTYDINVGTGGEWYQPFLDEARRRGMLVLINAEIGDSLSRGEMAELIYRLSGSL